MSDSHDYWFPSKRYGWGWGLPSHKMGWVTLITYIAVVTGSAFLIDAEERMGMYIGFVALCTIALIAICWIKGERPEWRWGKD
ncbi:MAG: hypothetical protein ACPG31_00710 [Planctomycetota bacterium]